MSHNLLIFFDGPQVDDYARLLGAALPQLSITIARNFEDCAAKIPDADILFAFGAQIRQRDILATAPRLQWVAAMGTGLDGIVDQPGLRADVTVTATRGIHGQTLGEMGLMLMLALARDFPRSVLAQTRRDWSDRRPAQLLRGKTIGILGVGAIAETFAPLCKALGMHVIGFTRTTRPIPGFDRMVTRDALVATAPLLDFLFLLIPATPQTTGIVNREVLAAMKPTAFVVNLARGQVVDEPALIEALTERRIGGAALDTFVNEPLPPDSPLWSTPNTIVTPHVAGYYDEYTEAAVVQFIDNYRAWVAHDPAAMTHVEQRGAAAR